MFICLITKHLKNHNGFQTCIKFQAWILALFKCDKNVYMKAYSSTKIF